MSITANYGVASNQGASPVNDSDVWYMTSFELVIATLEGEKLVPFSHAPYKEGQSITVSHTRGWNVSAGGGVSAPSGSGSMNLGWGYHSDTTVQPAAQKHFATTYRFWEKDPNHVDPLANPRPATNMHSSRWEVELTKYLTAERFAFLKRHVHALDIIPPEAFGYKTKEFYTWSSDRVRITSRLACTSPARGLCASSFIGGRFPPHPRGSLRDPPSLRLCPLPSRWMIPPSASFLCMDCV